MRQLRVIALALLVVLVAVPVAMAADGCAGGGTMCAAPCSAPCIAAPISAGDPVLSRTETIALLQRVHLRVAPLDALDAPPKSPRSA